MASNNPSPALDTIGNYDLLEKVGEGSMGTVYKARHWETKVIVAVKVMHADVAKNQVLLKRFEQEFRITYKLDHPNVVRMLEFSGQGPSPYMVMEFIEGESLGDKLERDGAMSEEEAIRIMVQVAHGLHRAHRQGLIHRDVKPDNIMMTPDGKAKLLDLGLAKDSDEGADLTRTGRGLGTPDFMAPEQFRNAKNASIRCDVYSLAATLYNMVTGKIPFGEEDPVKSMTRKLKNELPAPRQFVRNLSERTDWAIRRGMSGDPETRPASCREFVEDLIGQSTRAAGKPEANADPADMWFIVYTDRDGATRTAKGTAKAIRRSIREGKLGDPAQARGSRCSTGPFDPLDQHLEFRDLVVGPSEGPALSEMSMINLSRLAGSVPPDTNTPIPPVRLSPDDEDALTQQWTRVDDAEATDDAEAGAEVENRPASPKETPDHQTEDNPSGSDHQEAGRSWLASPWVQLLLLVAVTMGTMLLAMKFLFPSR